MQEVLEICDKLEGDPLDEGDVNNALRGLCAPLLSDGVERVSDMFGLPVFICYDGLDLIFPGEKKFPFAYALDKERL